MQTACVVIGAGPAGVTVARALLAAGIEHVVLERGEVAETWRRQRWDNFRLNTPSWMNAALGPVEPGTFPGRDEIVARLCEQASGLPIRARTPVSGLEHDGNQFVVRTPAGELTAATVVLACGYQNVPKVPAAARLLAPRLHQVHVAGYTGPAALPPGAVLVVGGGQSGCQVAEDLALAGRRVHLSTSRVGRYPWIHRGRELMAWQVESGHWDQRPQDLADPAETRAPIPVVGSGGHSLDLRILDGLGVRLHGRLGTARGEQVHFDASLIDNIAYADAVAARLLARADAYITERGLPAPEPDPDPGFAPSGSAVISELDLAAENVTSVIWASGFTADLSWARLPIINAEGRPRHDRTASPVPGLWYLGLPWLTRRRSGILFGFAPDADEVVDGVRRRLAGR